MTYPLHRGMPWREPHDEKLYPRLGNGHPYPGDFPDVESYERAFFEWRALNREHQLNGAEAEARWAVVEAEIMRRASRDLR